MRHWMSLLVTVLVTVGWSDIIWARPRYNYRAKDNDARGQIGKSRYNQCKETGVICHTGAGGGYCCKGLICVRRLNQRGEQLLDIPGQCVRERDLEQCDSNADCHPDCRCVEVGRRGAKYCLQMSLRTPPLTSPLSPPLPPPQNLWTSETEITPKGNVQITDTRWPPKKQPVEESQNRGAVAAVTHLRMDGGFGSSCETNAGCNQQNEMGMPLCCQIVRRGRQLPKQMCDYITPISLCIP